MHSAGLALSNTSTTCAVTGAQPRAYFIDINLGACAGQRNADQHTVHYSSSVLTNISHLVLNNK